MSQVKTAISLRGVLLKEADDIAQELKVPRSQLFSLALEEFIRRYRNKKLLEQINAAYTTPPDSDEIESIEIIRSHQRDLGGREEWK
ncbi:MAG: hypothetical protein MUO64_02410 [Anaerolineales bacterium]|nr:hypothetical protein [Anaerolineales bacterium]